MLNCPHNYVSIDLVERIFCVYNQKYLILRVQLSVPDIAYLYIIFCIFIEIVPVSNFWISKTHQQIQMTGIVQLVLIGVLYFNDGETCELTSSTIYYSIIFSALILNPPSIITLDGTWYQNKRERHCR